VTSRSSQFRLRAGPVLVLLALLPAACSAGGATPTPAPTIGTTASSGPASVSTPAPSPTAVPLSGTITFWDSYSEGGGQNNVVTTLDQIISSFEAQNPGVTVKHQEIGYSDLRQKLVTGIAGGEVPDVLRADITWVPEFANDGALLALDQAMPDFTQLADQTFAGPLATNKWDGHYYGLPLDTNTRLLFYSKSIFAKAGISTPPATIDEFEADMAKIKASGASQYGYAEGGTGSWNILPWVFSMGGGITNADLTQATGVLNGPQTVAAVQKLYDWIKLGYLSPSILGGGLGTTDALGKGNTAMIVDGPWMPDIFSNQYPNLDYGLAPLPTGAAGGVSVVGGEDIVVFKQTQNQAAALAFTRFMLSSEAQLAMGKVGNMPVLKSLTGNSELPSYYAIFQQQMQTALPRTPTPQWSKIDDVVTNAVLKALRGDETVQNSLNDAAATIDALLKQQQ
jgi:ABC-type glycerol-3-phosphate transport system substrate-binding protein